MLRWISVGSNLTYCNLAFSYMKAVAKISHISAAEGSEMDEPGPWIQVAKMRGEATADQILALTGI